jgi:hypothetical protein
VTFLTQSNIEQILLDQPWNGTASDLANLYLLSLGAESIGDEAPRPVGLGEGTTCYVFPDYIYDNGAFDDFVVHEAVHIFHNCKRASIGLLGTRSGGCEWLQAINYRKRNRMPPRLVHPE